MSYQTRLTCRRFSLFITALLFCLSSFAQTNFDAVDQLFKQNQKALGNYAVVLVKDTAIYKKSATQDFTGKSPAPMGASANWLTAALVMTFVDEGKLSLDDKVTTYIPLFGKYMKGYITIRNCLTHTTGIKGDAGRVMSKPGYETLEDLVNSYATKHDILTNPGTEFYYTNIGPNIAARVLEILSKKSFERLIAERICRPLKMRGTQFANDNGGATDPSGGARTTANDYANFLTMLLNKGTFEGKRILSEKAVEEMEKAQFANLPVKSAPKGLEHTQFGLGAFILESNGPGGSASLLAAPDMEGTAAYLDNCRHVGGVVVVEKPAEEKKPLYLSLINLTAEALGGGCK